MAREIDAETTPSLLIRIRDRDDNAAWTEFVEVYSPLIYGFCRTRHLQACDAADLTQEVLLRVSKSIGHFEYDRQQGLFRDWLARIVNNEIKRQISGKRLTSQLAEGVDDPVQTSTWNELYQKHLFETALKRCKKHFTEETWQLFELSWLKRVPSAVVAEQRAVEIQDVYVARSRVLKRLRHEVSVLADDLF